MYVSQALPGRKDNKNKSYQKVARNRACGFATNANARAFGPGRAFRARRDFLARRALPGLEGPSGPEPFVSSRRWGRQTAWPIWVVWAACRLERAWVRGIVRAAGVLEDVQLAHGRPPHAPPMAQGVPTSWQSERSLFPREWVRPRTDHFPFRAKYLLPEGANICPLRGKLGKFRSEGKSILWQNERSKASSAPIEAEIEAFDDRGRVKQSTEMIEALLRGGTISRSGAFQTVRQDVAILPTPWCQRGSR